MPKQNSPQIKKYSNSGFTLVELLIVISILAVLAVIGLNVFNNVQKSARETKRREDLAALAQAVRMYYFTNGSFPGTGSGCSNNTTDPGKANWDSMVSALSPTYIQNFPKDPLEGSTNGCATSACRYCYAPNMWWNGCDWGIPGDCQTGKAAFYTYQETYSTNTGDSVRFKYMPPTNLYLKSIDPF